MNVKDAEKVLADPVNAELVELGFVQRLPWRDVGKRLGLKQATVTLRKNRVAKAYLVLAEGNQEHVEAYRAEQVARVEELLKESLIAFRSEVMRPKVADLETGRPEFDPVTKKIVFEAQPTIEELYDLAGIVSKYENLLTGWVGTRQPEKVDVGLNTAVHPMDDFLGLPDAD